MPADHDACHRRINWPADLDEDRFLTQYWQRRPLLIRQALPGFQTPLPADELAGLSLEADTTPRLITRDVNGDYHLEHGPFEAGRFQQLTGNDWSLLVTDVEKHLPELAVYLQAFTFLPCWRIDDLMVSYAPVGASVGAHIDEYDVFLLQASGKRRWSIDARAEAEHELDPDSELKLLTAFEPTDTWELTAGDLLYLPPGVPHHGIASDDPCTTWSIGFRAPVIADMVMRMAEMICESMPHERFTDGPLKVATPGEISADALQRITAVWQRAVTLDQDTLTTLSGRLLTETGGGSPADVLSDWQDADAVPLQIGPFSRAAWIAARQDRHVQLFVDGEVYLCSRELAIDLCTPGYAVTPANERYSDEDRTLLKHLVRLRVVISIGH
jgi:50S ribosomal protein L16 3-hydroxylase